MKIVKFVIALLIYILASPLFANDLDQKITLKGVDSYIEEVLIKIDEKYVYPDVAKVMRELVNKEVSAGNYRNIRSQKELIEKLQSDLRIASKDRHISLHLAKGRTDRKAHVLPTSKPFNEFEVSLMPGKTDKNNIGYLRFDKFSGDAKSKDRILNSMKELVEADSLIIDLRENRGGDPNLVAFLSSFFLENNTHLWSILDRNTSTTFEAFSEEQDIKYHGDLCILTSKNTYSAPESFAYTLKHLGRACIIGENTGGGAHLVQMERVNDDIDIRIPVARAYNSITKSNWEGVGVIPSIEVEASEAKSVAIEYFNNKNR